jgi:uncharacterized protein (TIGR02001 family)
MMGKTLSRAMMLAMATGIMATPAAIAEGEFSANVAFTTDYVYRGVTQTDGAPTVSGGLDWASDDFYVGGWMSGVDFGDGSSTEVDIYAGFTPTVGMFDLDLGAIYYIYPDAPDDPEQNFVEVYAGASTTVSGIDLGASYAYSPEFYGETGSAGYTNFTAGTALGENFGIDASVGFSDFYDSGNDSYTDYSVGVTTSVQEYFDLDFRAIATSGLDGNDEKFVVTLSRSL